MLIRPSLFHSTHENALPVNQCRCCLTAQVRGYQRDIAILSQQLNTAKIAMLTQKRTTSANGASHAAGLADLDEGPPEEALQIKAISISAVPSSAQLVA